MARRAAREAAMKLLYQRSFSEDYDLDALESMMTELSLDEQDLPYINDIIHGWLLQKDEIDRIIEDKARGWKLERIAKIDLSILRLSLYEIIYRSDIPNSVSINEGVELAKKYSNEKSAAFINGLLGAYMREIERTGSESIE